MMFFETVSHLIPDWLLFLGAVVPFILNMYLWRKKQYTITTRWDRFLVGIAYGQLAFFYLYIHMAEMMDIIDLAFVRGISRFVWGFFIMIGLLNAWQYLMRSKDK